jgi:hypothetical protein
MNEWQAFAAIRNALRLENLSRDLAAKVTPELALIFKNVREMLRTMPPEQIGREIRYRQLRLQLADMFSTANRTFYNELRAGLDGEVLRQVQWAADWLRSAEGRVEQELLAVVPRDGISVTTTAGMTGSYGGSGLSFTPSASGSFAAGNLQFTRTQLVAITQRTEVLGKSLEEIFMPSDQMSVWIKDNLKLIDRVVKQGFLLGETNEEIAKQLPGVGQVAVTRNRAIARTAVMDMSQRAHEAFWDAQDEGIIQRWVFDATFDFRVCMQCAPWDGKEVTERSRLPQTPIHPNCVLGDTPVAAGGVIAATRAVYSGDIVTVRTESGRQFSVTAQHPVLTDRGWVRANELGNGLNLIAHRERIPSSLDLPDLNNGPTTAAQVFEAFCASPGVTTDAVPPTPMQFHGDGKAIKGDVEVVWSQRPLQLNSSAESFQAFSEFSGIGADAKLFLESGFSPTDLLFIWLNAAANGLVSLADECQALLRGECSLTQAHSFAARVRGHSCLFEPIYDNRPAAAEALGNALDALASLVSRDQIVDVQVEATHELAVYDFTTLSGIYSMDQALGHNCRCRVLPVTATELELRRSGESLTQVGDRSYVEIRKEKPEGSKDVRVYKTKTKVGSKRFYKVSKDIKPEGNRAATMADFLNKASHETRIAVMGKENARRFVEMVTGSSGSRKRLTPDEALREIVRNPYRRRK